MRERLKNTFFSLNFELSVLRGVLRNIDHCWGASARWWSTVFDKRAALRVVPLGRYRRKCHFLPALIIGVFFSGFLWDIVAFQ